MAGNKVKNQYIQFNFLQAPLVQLGENHTFESFVEVKDHQMYDAMMQQYQLDHNRAKQDHDRKIILWQQRCDTEKELYDLKMKEYYAARQNGSFAVPPVLNLPDKPIFVAPMRPEIGRTYDNIGLRDRNLNIDGYQYNPDSKIKYRVVMHGLKYSEPRILTKEKITKGKDGSTMKVMWYAYEIRFKQPMSVKIYEEGGAVLFEKFYTQFDQDKVIVTKEYPSKHQLIQSENPDQILFREDTRVVEDQMIAIGREINMKYGYPIISKGLNIYTAKSRKHTYKDYISAFDKAQIGYKSILNEPQKANQKLSKAVSIWRTALKESNQENKKARINLKITYATYINIANACMWMGKFDQAEHALSEARLLNKRKARHVYEIESKRRSINEMKARAKNFK